MKAEHESGRLNLVLQMSSEFVNNTKDIRFYNEEGKPLEIWSRGSFTFGNASKQEYTLKTEILPKALSVEIEIWQELEVMNLPFEIESGVGF